jgi:hypothetical protein
MQPSKPGFLAVWLPADSPHVASQHAMLLHHPQIKTDKMEDLILHFLQNEDDIIIAMKINNYLIQPLQSQKKNWGGSVNRRMVINCGLLEGNFQFFNNYFSKNPELMFCQRFRMQIGFFCQIVQDLQNHDKYFLQKRNASGKLGFSSIQKITADMRMMAYGCSMDSLDEYTRMSKPFLSITLDEI